MQVSKNVLASLDYYKVVEELAQYFIAFDSQQRFLAQRPVFSTAIVSELHKKVNNFSIASSMAELPAVNTLQSILGFLPYIAKRDLHIEEAMQLRTVLETMRICHNWAHINEYSFFSQRDFPKNLYDTFVFYFDSKGVLRSINIPELNKLETTQVSLQRQRMKIAQEFIRTHRHICQSDQATLRDHKILVPIKSSFYSQVQGNVHSSSASSETVFIELYNIQNKNNEMEYLHYKKQKILYAICQTISESLRCQLDMFCQFYEQFLEFDMIQAQYMYGKRIKGQLVPIVSAKNSTKQEEKKGVFNETNSDTIKSQEIFFINLVGATHPLFLQSEPIDIYLQHNYKQLVITGANGGGKTFALKVLGLLVLMNQSGIPIPVKQLSCLPVFSNIALVIGDIQNINKGLSTFTAHLQAIQNAMYELCDKEKESESENCLNDSTKNIITNRSQSLFLIDEICSDTDDREGGTLAWAILEYLEQCNIYTVVTTHLALLKQYAISKENVEIAAAEVNRKNMKHIIRYGVIGSSEAELCAKQVGIHPSILHRHQDLLSEHGKEYHRYLQKLQQYVTRWEQKNKQITAIEQKLQRKQREQSQKEHILQEKEENLLKKNYVQGTQLLHQLRKAIEQIQTLQNYLQKTRQKFSDSQKKIKEFRVIAKSAQQELENVKSSLQQKQEQIPLEYFEVGAMIQLKKNKATGTVIEKLVENYYIVNVGIIKMRVHASEMYLQRENIDTDSQGQLHHSHLIIERNNREHSFKNILDLRGCRVEEAIRVLDRNIDMALLQREITFSVIHGKGEGVLRKAIHEYVIKHTAVLRTEFANPEEGGDALTKVYIDN